MGPLKPRLAPMRSGAASTSGSGGFWCKYLPEGSGEAPEGSVRLQRAPVQIPCEDLEGSGADTLWGSGSFRCRYSVRFRRVTAQIACTMTKQVFLILCDFIWFCSSNMRNESLIFDSRAFWYATWPNKDAYMAWNMRLDLNHDQRVDKRPWKPVKNGWLKIAGTSTVDLPDILMEVRTHGFRWMFSQRKPLHWQIQQNKILEPISGPEMRWIIISISASTLENMILNQIKMKKNRDEHTSDWFRWGINHD